MSLLTQIIISGNGLLAEISICYEKALVLNNNFKEWLLN